jgi:DNA polymerase-1
MERLHILDGYGYIFRAYFGMASAGRNAGQRRLSNAEGMPTGALYVYASMMLRLHQEVRPDRVVVVFDAPGKNFRDELDPNYKKTRKPTPDDLKAQLPYFRPLTEAFCWPVISVKGVEADDTIATIARSARDRDWDVVVYSGDKDLMQLVDDRTTVIDSMRRITYDQDKVKEKFGVRPDQLGDWLALVGDTSDTVPGMVGVGKVGATKLLDAYGDLQGILKNVDELKGKQQQRFCDAENLRQLELSKKLVTLKTDVEIQETLDSFVPMTWESSALEALCEKFNFKGLIERLSGKGGFAEGPRPAAEMAAKAKTKAQAANAAAQDEASSERIEVALQAATIVTEADALEAEISAAKVAGRVAIHFEGDGSGHDRERLVGLGMIVPGRAPVYLPVAHRYLGAPRALKKEFLAGLAEILADPSLAIVCHGAKTLRKILAREGIGLAGVDMDLMLATYLLNPETDTHLIAAALEQAIGIELPARETLVGKGKKAVSWEMVEVGHAATFVGPHLCALLASTSVIEAALKREGMSALFHELELPLARVLADIEANGITLDQAVLSEIRDDVSARIAVCENTVFDIAEHPFNLGSPKQLSKFLFETLVLKSEVMKKTKTGFSTDHEVLEAMLDTHSCIAPIMEHRELVKLKGTYIDALPPLVNAKSGRLHTTFRQDVAATGRLSSQEPNLQNIPIRTEMGRSIRRAFVAPKGKVLISADYSQIELRIMAHLSEDPVLMRAFVEGIDVHTQTAAEVFDISLDEVGKSERRVAKAVNYGLIYGQSEFGLARALGITRPKAGHYINRYFERFSMVRTFMDEIVNQARDAGAAFTVCGRKRPIPGLAAKNFRVRSAAERVAQNTPMQGSAADIMKLAMLKVETLLEGVSGDAKMLLTVHDELIIEAAESDAKDLAAQVRAEMESAYQLKVPLIVDVGIATSWADAH